MERQKQPHTGITMTKNENNHSENIEYK